MDLNNYLKAGYPGFYIETLEPLRAIATLKTGNWQSYSWDCLRGITERETSRITEDFLDPLAAVKWLGERNDTVLFVQNFHHFVTSVEIIQEIQNSIPIWKASGCSLAMVGPPVNLPREIGNFFTVLDFKLPSQSELRLIQEELAESVGVEVAE
ncbi:MAG TPA: AAA family ATPase, partial [Deltaproteobacteria bacterium]|nr:AAA family ATPase [Deltaproteobacteria bacterium]